ncbi:hypothetical protein [Streptomyces sp. NPDC048527]|uniref:hypothetical protein n=1 Tax=Streptomyces sp. NPDC048527 TaxID=3365568 RepID=UPI00371828F8
MHWFTLLYQVPGAVGELRLAERSFGDRLIFRRAEAQTDHVTRTPRQRRPRPAPARVNPTTAAELPSAAVLVGVVEREYDRRLANLRALDGKAGALLAFDGAVVALNRGLPFLWQVPSIAFSAASAVFAAMVLWPREIRTLHPSRLVQYVAAEAETTMLAIQDNTAIAVEQIEAAAKPKRQWIKASLVCLALAAAVFSVGVINPHLPKGSHPTHDKQLPTARPQSRPGPSHSATPGPAHSDPAPTSATAT